MFVAHDPQKAWLTGPSKGVAGEHANFIGNMHSCFKSKLLEKLIHL